MVDIEERAEALYNIEEESKNHIYRTYTPEDVTLIKKVAYIRGAKDERKRLTEWREIEADEDGFATGRAAAEILKSLPVLLYYDDNSYHVIENGDTFTEWSGDLFHHPSRYKWRPIR